MSLKEAFSTVLDDLVAMSTIVLGYGYLYQAWMFPIDHHLAQIGQLWLMFGAIFLTYMLSSAQTKSMLEDYNKLVDDSNRLVQRLQIRIEALQSKQEVQ